MDKNRFTIFQSLTLLRRLALDAALIDPDAYEGVTSAKREYLVERLPELLADGHRVLVFSQFTGYLKSIARPWARRVSTTCTWTVRPATAPRSLRRSVPGPRRCS